MSVTQVNTDDLLRKRQPPQTQTRAEMLRRGPKKSNTVRRQRWPKSKYHYPAEPNYGQSLRKEKNKIAHTEAAECRLPTAMKQRWRTAPSPGFWTTRLLKKLARMRRTCSHHRHQNTPEARLRAPAAKSVHDNATSLKNWLRGSVPTPETRLLVRPPPSPRPAFSAGDKWHTRIGC